EKETILQTVWPDAVVEDSNLTQTVHLLRKALGKNGDSQPRIETIPKVGYRLVAEVRELWDQNDDPAPNLPTPVHEAGAAMATPIPRESAELIFQEPSEFVDEEPAYLFSPAHELIGET
ncbi:MAG: winged helix-turn-helix domain-containing protein, partial [Blastocatellia bacterium]